MTWLARWHAFQIVERAIRRRLRAEPTPAWGTPEYAECSSRRQASYAARRRREEREFPVTDPNPPKYYPSRAEEQAQKASEEHYYSSLYDLPKSDWWLPIGYSERRTTT